MAHLWVSDVCEQWCVLPLEGEAYGLATNPPQPWRERDQRDGARPRVVLLRSPKPEGGAWVLLAGPPNDVRVNGFPMASGIRVVADRDEIRVAGLPAVFFSTESLARVEPLPGASQKLFCPRCKQEIEKAALAVKCPQCGVWHHQSDELPCWSYAERCALCSQSTDLNAGYRWTPEEL